MGYLHCCGGLRRCASYSIVPQEGYLLAELDILEECPVCENYAVQVTRIDIEHNVSVVRKSNIQARKLFENVKSSIIRRQDYKYSVNQKGKSYLYYNEFGTKKRCYSNLSTLKMGMLDNLDGIFITNPIKKMENIKMYHHKIASPLQI